MIDLENIYFSDISLCAFILYCTRRLKRNDDECEIDILKLKEDCLIDETEVIRLMKIIKAEKNICANVDEILTNQNLRNHKLKMKFDKSFLSKLEEVKVAEKKGNSMIKRINRSTFVFCGTLTDEEKRIKELLDNYVESNTVEEKPKSEVSVKTEMTRQELSIYFKRKKEEKQREKDLIKATIEEEIKNFKPKEETFVADEDDDFDADDILPDGLFV